MTKIMLVEDDKSLREIYGVRLLAEGYDIVSAGDGEEALAMAIKERPQLIISDVMMPKVSGYDMLDILRSTTETKNIRVIMMTALSSEEQRTRAESLGADRYLVKSQVGIEDVVRVVHEVLEDTPETMHAAAVPKTMATTPPTSPAATLAPIPTPGSIAPPPLSTNPVAPIPVAPSTSLPQPGSVLPTTAPKGPSSTIPMPGAPKGISEAPKPASLKTRVIQPISDPSVPPININDLLDKELAKEAGIADNERPAVASASQEKAQIEAELQAFEPPSLTPVEAPSTSPAPSSPPAPTSSTLPTPGVVTPLSPPDADATMAMPTNLPTVEPPNELPPVAPPKPSVPPSVTPSPTTVPTPMQPLPTTPPTSASLPPAPASASPLPTPNAPMAAPPAPSIQKPLESPGATNGTGPAPVPQLPEVPKI